MTGSVRHSSCSAVVDIVEMRDPLSMREWSMAREIEFRVRDNEK